MKIYKKLPYRRYNIILVIKGEFKTTDLDRPYARIFNVVEVVCDAEESCEYISSRMKNPELIYDIEPRFLAGEICNSSYREYCNICDKINRRKYKSLCFQLRKNREYESIKRKAESKHAEKVQRRKA